jgi:hypothetical protein
MFKNSKEKKLFENGEHPLQLLFQKTLFYHNKNKKCCSICFDKDNLRETIDDKFICDDCIRIQKNMYKNIIKLKST